MTGAQVNFLNHFKTDSYRGNSDYRQNKLLSMLALQLGGRKKMAKIVEQVNALHGIYLPTPPKSHLHAPAKNYQVNHQP